MTRFHGGFAGAVAVAMLAAGALDASALSIADLSVALKTKVTLLPGARPLCVSTGDPTRPGGTIAKCVALTQPTPVEAQVVVDKLGVVPIVTLGPAGLPTQCPSINLRVNVTAVNAYAMVLVKVGDTNLVAQSVGPTAIGDFVALCQ